MSAAESRRLSTGQSVAKRSLDLVASVAGLILLWWLILLGWVAASIDTGQNGFFTQTRIGRRGAPFTAVKLRTMRSQPGGTSTVTTSTDPRITRLGALLRRTKIDELPQLWNVATGRMSLVGPRPDVAGFADELEGADRAVLELRPGITGAATLKYRHEEELLASVEDPEAYNREVIYPDKVRINLEYMRDYSLAGDFRLIIRTVLGR